MEIKHEGAGRPFCDFGFCFVLSQSLNPLAQASLNLATQPWLPSNSQQSLCLSSQELATHSASGQLPKLQYHIPHTAVSQQSFSSPSHLETGPELMLPRLEAHCGLSAIQGSQHRSPAANPPPPARVTFSLNSGAPGVAWDYKINNLRRVRTLQLSVRQPGECACLGGQKPKEKIGSTVSH